MKLSSLVAIISLCCLSVRAAEAVYVSSEGMGQALIFPYYTANSSSGNPFNTYISIVNHTSDAKAVRVRFREGHNSREVASFNLFLSPNDAWTGAVLPSGSGARLVTTDASCTSPALSASGGGVSELGFASTNYAGAAADGGSEGLERTREGWLEVIEMATLTGASAANVTHTFQGVPANCAAVHGNAVVETASPSGGLSGTLTLINVASGMDFTLNAEALAELSSRPFYRPASDPYPDFAAAEIEPISVILDRGFVYRSVWSNGRDAVSAVLMRTGWAGEFILDAGTNSATDFVTTFPTRQHYAGTSFSPPFSGNCRFPPGEQSGESVRIFYTDRDERGEVYFGREVSFQCGASVVFDVRNTGTIPYGPSTGVLGSQSRALVPDTSVRIPTRMSNGWMNVSLASPLGLTSLPTSTRMDVATGAITTGAHRISGLPLVGFTVRTFRNDSVSCANGVCQGNYGGAFPMKYTRAIGMAN